MLGVRNGTDGDADGRPGSGNSLRDHRARESRRGARDAKSAHKGRAYGWQFEAQCKRPQGTIAWNYDYVNTRISD